MTKAAWYHLFQLALTVALITLLSLRGADSLVWWLWVTLGAQVILSVSSLLLLSNSSHECIAKCAICRKKK